MGSRCAPGEATLLKGAVRRGLEDFNILLAFEGVGETMVILVLASSLPIPPI
jgi:hypothetical protein